MNSSRLLRYSSALATTAALSSDATAAFTSPYLMTNGIFTGATTSANLGDWNYLLNNANPDISLNVGPGNSFILGNTFVGDFTQYTYDLTTTAAASGLVSFNANHVVSNAGFAFIRNSTVAGTIATATGPFTGSTGSAPFSFAVTAGDTFGFRFSFQYSGGPTNGNMTITGFSAPVVPEPASTAAWMAAGALGLLGVRAARRRAARSA